MAKFIPPKGVIGEEFTIFMLVLFCNTNSGDNTLAVRL